MTLTYLTFHTSACLPTLFGTLLQVVEVVLVAFAAAVVEEATGASVDVVVPTFQFGFAGTRFGRLSANVEIRLVVGAAAAVDADSAAAPRGAAPVLLGTHPVHETKDLAGILHLAGQGTVARVHASASCFVASQCHDGIRPGIRVSDVIHGATDATSGSAVLAHPSPGVTTPRQRRRHRSSCHANHGAAVEAAELPRAAVVVPRALLHARRPLRQRHRRNRRARQLIAS